MRSYFRWVLLSAVCLLFPSAAAFSQQADTQGLIAGWLTANSKKTIKPQIGLRYIPTFTLGKELGDSRSLDFEFSLNIYGTGNIYALDDIQTDGDLKPYRAWLRYSTSQFEARLGLQKINFGSAAMLRPLMWFDQIDPRDPLQLTDGVYGLLLRFYFLNNANIWLWGLSGNENPKGWESIASDQKIPEFGGRFQYPLGNGEAAVTYHHREIEIKGLLGEWYPEEGNGHIGENRFAVDGKWDLGIGLWFEAVLTHQNSAALYYDWQQAFTVGMDTTFGWGNGLNLIVEYFQMDFGRKAFDSAWSVKFSALALNYPVGLLDSLSGILYYDWENQDVYSFIRWQRTYDRWSFHLMGFWNPDLFQIYQLPEASGGNPFIGKGIQIMVVFNY